MNGFLFEHFIELDLLSALQVVLLGFIGGILSGFIGSGGAFFMTPGMMNLGVPGVVAVGSNITHKFGKAMMGSKKHGEYGNVDKRLAAFLVATSFVGIRLAVWINSVLVQRRRRRPRHRWLGRRGPLHKPRVHLHPVTRGPFDAA